MLKNLSENLNMLMAKARLTSNELAKQIAIPATTIKRIRNNEQANPTLATLLPIAKYFSISLDKLIGEEKNIINNVGSTMGLQRIPVLSWAECIYYNGLNSEKYSKQIFIDQHLSQKAFALLVEDSDLKIFPKNSVLIVEPDTIPAKGDFVIVANEKNNIATIRKYIIEIDQIYLKSMIDGPEISILSPDYKILGVIIQYRMELKKY